MGTAEMETIAELIHRAVTQTDGDPDHAVAKEVRAEVTDLVRASRHTLGADDTPARVTTQAERGA